MKEVQSLFYERIEKEFEEFELEMKQKTREELIDVYYFKRVAFVNMIDYFNLNEIEHEDAYLFLKSSNILLTIYRREYIYANYLALVINKRVANCIYGFKQSRELELSPLCQTKFNALESAEILDLFYDKIENEYNEYIDELRQKSIEELINEPAFKKVLYENILDYFKFNGIDYKNAQMFLEEGNILKNISSRYSDHDDEYKSSTEEWIKRTLHDLRR